VRWLPASPTLVGWNHIVGTCDKDGGANNQRLWLNGAVEAEATVSGALQAGTESMGIGEEISGTADPFDELIDEIRISTVVRSDAWLKATYRNLSTPATLFIAGAQEDGAGGPAPRRPVVMTIFV